MYEVRRGRFILAMVILNLFATVLGIYSRLKLKYGGVLVHAFYCVGIIAAFYIYIIIDYFMTRGRNETKSKDAWSPTAILLLASIPLFGLFLMGCYSFFLLIRLDQEYEARSEQENEFRERIQAMPMDQRNRPAP